MPLGSGQPTRVLVVDDSPVSRKMLLKLLPQGWSYESSQAGNGQEALAAVAATAPDVVLLDLNMPVMDGYEFLQNLAGAQRRPIVIVISGDIQPIARERALTLGANAFVKKPLSTQAIEAALRDCELM
jgi:two-component system, chemotaxis family, chemotaxis protein CheY